MALDIIGEKIRSALSAKHAARERALQLSREATRHSSNAIRAVHRGEQEPAEALLASARALLDDVEETLCAHEDVYHAGFVHDAQKEYVEGRVTLSLVAGHPIPDPDDLGVSYAAYLNGIGEAVGELRRYLLDAIRRGEEQRCEELLSAMDDIYSLLVTLDFPDALTGGLRRTTDNVRGILERTRGDLTMSIRQRELERKLSALAKEGPGPPQSL